jgi:hypothetical protein
MNAGTMNVTGNQLHGDEVFVNTSSVADTFNVTGVTALDIADGVFGGGSIIVNLAKNSEWIGHAALSAPGVTTKIQGAGTWYNSGQSFVGGSEYVGVNVIGNGSFYADHGHGSGKIEFAHSVGSGQTVGIDYAGYGIGGGIVQVDNPALYHATTDLSIGQLILEGLKASSYAYEDNTLTLFNGKNVVDRLHLVSTTNAFYPALSGPVVVTQVAGAVDISRGVGAISGTTLPLHV